MSKLHEYHELVIGWARDNGFGDPCGCSGMCAHQRFSAGSPDKDPRYAEMAEQSHAEYDLPSPFPRVRYYFWVGGAEGADDMEALCDKLLPIGQRLVKEGADVGVQCLSNCGVEFTPTRLPCETVSLIVGVSEEADRCRFCCRAWGEHQPHVPPEG